MHRHTRSQALAALCAVVSVAGATAMMEMEGSDLEPPNIRHAGPKTAHWLMALALQLVLPSVSAVLVLSGRIHSAALLQGAAACYAVLDVLLLSFPDGDGIENRTSKGTGVTVLLLTALTVLFAALHLGSQRKDCKHTRSVQLVHRVLSVVVVVAGWVRCCMAPVAMFGFCRDVHTGQCIAHGIMGSAFVGYGFIYAMVLVIPRFRERTGGQSQELYDSVLMTAWGVVNTFTEHRWGREPWGHGDYQHTAMGILWWCGGLLGIFLSRGGRRSFVPALLLIYTGWAMSQHAQALAVSTKVHQMFGIVLMAGGALRIVEISFLLHDERSIPGKLMTFQYLPSFCLVEAGVMFMSANEEQLELVLRLKADHSSYIMVIVGASFMVYLWMLLLLELHQKLTTTSRLQLAGYTSVLRNTDDVNDFELNDLEDQDGTP